mgnify:CR=1 FL=1
MGEIVYIISDSDTLTWGKNRCRKMMTLQSFQAMSISFCVPAFRNSYVMLKRGHGKKYLKKKLGFRVSNVVLSHSSVEETLPEIKQKCI